MGGFFGGLASGLGGAGDAALQIGGQLRGLLEQNRESLANTLMQAANSEGDTGTRAGLFSLIADLHARKPVGQIAQGFHQLLTKRAQDEQKLTDTAKAMGIGAGTAAPPPPAGPVKQGFTPGSGGNAAASEQPAAQPASNPVQGAIQPIGNDPDQTLNTGAGPGAIPPIPTSSPQIPQSPDQSMGGITLPQDPAEIVQKYLKIKSGVTPVNYTTVDDAMKQELTHNEALRQEATLRQMDLNERQKAFADIHSGPAWDQMPGWQQAQWLAWSRSRSAPLPALPIGAIRPVNTGGVMPSSAVSDEERLDINGKPITIQQSPFVRQHMDLMNRRVYYSPATGPEIQAIDPKTGNRTSVPNLPNTSLGPTPGVAGSEFGTRNLGVDPTGHEQLGSVAGLQNGVPPVTAPGVAIGALPSTTTVQVPGQLPEVHTTVKGHTGGKTSAPSAPPIASTGGPGGPVSSLPASADPSIRQAYSDWAAGGAAPTGKKLVAVDTYRAEHNLPLPTTMSAAGQANLQAVDAVDLEVKDAMKALNSIKGNPILGGYNILYRNGHVTPYDTLFTKLSFEGLRSAAAALKGNNSRALPIINRAFQHVPNLDRLGGANPDSVDMMKDKLKAMQDILRETREAVLQDEHKSGVIPGGGISHKVPANADEYLQSIGAH